MREMFLEKTLLYRQSFDERRMFRNLFVLSGRDNRQILSTVILLLRL